MVDALTFSGARIPEDDEANDPPADFLRFGTDIDDLLVLKATSEADRNTKYADVTAGTLVSCADLQTVWQKLTSPPTAASWLTIFENVSATSGILTAGTNFSVSDQWGIRRNGFVSLRLTMTYGSGTEILGDDNTIPGNVADTQIGTVSTDWRPPVDWTVHFRSSVANWAGRLTSAGALWLDSGVPAGRLRTGDFIAATFTFPKV